MVKVMRSIVTGPLEPYAAGFAEDLLRQGYTWTSAEQQVCFITHLDRWMSGEGVGLDGLSRPVLERYLVERRAAGYVEYRSWKALRPLLNYLAAAGRACRFRRRWHRRPVEDRAAPLLQLSGR